MHETSTVVNVTIPLFSVILTIVYLAGTWKLYTKANQAGFKCLIPFYNLYTEYKIVYGEGWRFVLLLIPVVNLFVLIMYRLRLAKVFGKGVGFGIGLILCPYIFVPILGFGNARYLGYNI